MITYFNAGATTTFPLFVWGAARVATPPQINVIGTVIFVVAVDADARQHRHTSGAGRYAQHELLR